MAKEDRLILEQIIERCSQNHWSEDHMVDSIATFFLGTPYVAGTLESEAVEEQIVVNLRQLDCLTYVENVLAVRMMLKKYEPMTFPVDSCVYAYPKIIQSIRYRNGELKDYTSRLHYTTEWLSNNQQKGYIRLITDYFSQQPFDLDVHYMSSHAESYAALCLHPEYVPQIAAIESNINKMSFHYIPKDNLYACVEDIPNGSIIAITTTADGLDIGHLGFAHRVGNTMYLLHASSLGKVVVSDKPLVSYLHDIKRFSGIMLAKIL